MFDQNTVFTQGLVQIIRSLKREGIEDITTEVVGLNNGNKQMRFRFHTEAQWLANPDNKANEATKILGKTYKNEYIMPDYVVTYDQVKYFVVIV